MSPWSPLIIGKRARINGGLVLIFSWIGCSSESAATPAITPQPASQTAPAAPSTGTTVPRAPETNALQIATVADAGPSPSSPEDGGTSKPIALSVAGDEVEALYMGKHKLGVNRVTDMARVGSATFSRSGGALKLEGRVVRGAHWLELAGTVEPLGSREFVLNGVLRGVPDMAWAGEAPRERRTEGRFTFQVKHGRPYWRMYKVNDRPCVCDDDCGNDFCYIDIELARASDTP